MYIRIEYKQVDCTHDWKLVSDSAIKEIAEIVEYKFSDHFISLKEFRKLKLNELSDKNFNDFLRRLKKV